MPQPYMGVQGSMRHVGSIAVGTARTLHGEKLATLLLANKEHLADVAAAKKLDLLEGAGSHFDL